MGINLVKTFQKGVKHEKKVKNRYSDHRATYIKILFFISTTGNLNQTLKNKNNKVEC